MTTEAGKSISPRGAFTIGLVLGAGLLLIYSILQTSRLKNEIDKLQRELEQTNSKVIKARADMLEMLNKQNEKQKDQLAK